MIICRQDFIAKPRMGTARAEIIGDRPQFPVFVVLTLINCTMCRVFIAPEIMRSKRLMFNLTVNDLVTPMCRRHNGESRGQALHYDISH